MVKAAFLTSVFLFAALVSADTYIVVSPDTYFFRPPNPNLIKIFDKDFFTPKESPQFTEGKSGDKRYYGEPQLYNTFQRAEWIAKCENEKQKSMNYFRKCFQEEQNKNQENLDKSIDNIHYKNNLPFKNSP